MELTSNRRLRANPGGYDRKSGTAAGTRWFEVHLSIRLASCSG